MYQSYRCAILGKLVLSFIMSSLIAGCATSPKTQAVQIGDDQLSCNSIIHELAKVDKAEKEIDSKKGITGTNVAAVLFWWPGLAYTYYDAAEATRLLNERRSHLTSIYNKKSCQ